MIKILKTLFYNIRFFFLHYFLIPLFLSVLAVLIYLIFDSKMHNKPLAVKALFKDRKQVIKTASLFTAVLYFAIVIQITLFSRIGTYTNSLSDIYGGWLITEDQFWFDFSPVWNILLFIPVSFCCSFLHYSFKNKWYNTKEAIIKSSVISFLLSIFIENIQLIFKLGTFQFSDLFYNTLGGFLGALLYILIKKKVSQKK